MNRVRFFTVFAASLLAATVTVARVSTADDDALTKTRAVYAALHSYSDTGTVDVELGPARGPIHEHHTFSTAYRAPRNFFFDFVKAERADRFVVWSDDAAFHSWWQQTAVTQDYPKGEGATAFMTGSTPTEQSLTMIAPLLFPQAGLIGTLTEFGDMKAAGTDSVNGHACVKITGTAKSVYTGTGHEVNIRRTTVWIDAQSLLVRKVFEDTPQGTAGTDVLRVTTTIDPQPNPTLGDTRFKFTPPSGRQ